MARWYTANILQTGAGGRRLWNLSASGDRFVVQGEKILLLHEPAPAGIAGKDWHTLFRGKLNIAWLPADKVFLRVVQLPPADSSEMSQMVELQLEKLSPLPVTHIVWSIYLLPRPANAEALQTVIVIIASRNAVEEFLGHLETEGFLADRLESPGLDQLLAAHIQRDGVWIFPGAAGEPALVAWWYGGTIQNLTLVSLPPGLERGPQLKTQIEQIAWAGELEGWLTGAPKIFLAAAPPDVTFWESVFKEAGEEIEVIAPIPAAELAALSAQRCAAQAGTSLLPQEYATRYHQRFIDGLWFRGLMAAGSAYVVFWLIYLGGSYGSGMQFKRVQNDLKGLGGSYTNSLKDAAQIQILRDRQQLKFASLDCWKTLAELLPDTMTVGSFYFQPDKLELSGTVTADDKADVTKFNEAMRNAPNPQHQGETLFTEVSPPSISSHGDSADWRFVCSLKKDKDE